MTWPVILHSVSKYMRFRSPTKIWMKIDPCYQYFRKQCPATSIIGHAMLSDINISHGSVATPLRCGGICNDVFIANFLLSVTVKEFWKSVIIWRSYGQEFGVLFFMDHGVDVINRIAVLCFISRRRREIYQYRPTRSNQKHDRQFSYYWTDSFRPTEINNWTRSGNRARRNRVTRIAMELCFFLLHLQFHMRLWRVTKLSAWNAAKYRPIVIFTRATLC